MHHMEEDAKQVGDVSIKDDQAPSITYLTTNFQVRLFKILSKERIWRRTLFFLLTVKAAEYHWIFSYGSFGW